MSGDIAATADTRLPLWLRRRILWARKVRLTNKIAIALLVAAVIAGIATWLALHTANPAENSTARIYLLLNLDLVLLLALGAFVARQAVGLWAGRKKGLAGSRLHVRLVFLFSLLAAVPAVLMAVFSAVFFYFGVNSWFSEQVSTAVNESLIVAQSYLEEHQQVMRADVLAMANDLNREVSLLSENPTAFSTVIQTQSMLRNLPEVIVFTSSGQILARSRLTFSLDFDPFPDSVMDQVRSGEVVLMTSESDDRIRALVKLDSYFDSYLFVGRRVDPDVLSHLDKTQSAVREYGELQGRQSELQLTVMLLFVAVTLLLLTGAVWFGLIFARQLAGPISNLVTATERVRAGDMLARVSEGAAWEEFTTLNRAFNRMTSQIRSQHEDLIEANRKIDDRRRFTEAVLSGVSAGVVGVDKDDVITIVNLSAARLLGLPSSKNLLGERLSDVVPEMSPILESVRSRDEGIAQAEITISGSDKKKGTFLVRACVEEESEGDIVVTFDDISELLVAQRKAAWADVARRIAHEIKNPLTPIQLSAERLRRKYLKEIKSDPETFQLCTETIERQVADIGRMVDEFSSFARMPFPVKTQESLSAICESALVLQRTAHRNIRFTFEREGLADVQAECDRQQIQQALTNLLQNAIDSIESAESTGEISLLLRTRGGQAEIVMEDNGKGLPDSERDKLTEPYVTTRQKGTGLGLAIVRKIMEDHGGSIVLEDRPDGQRGARITITLHMEENERKVA